MCGVYVHTHISVWECKVQSPISSDLCISHSFHFSSTSSLFHFRDNGELTLVWIPIKNIRNGLQKQGYNSYCCALSLSEDLNRILLVFLCVLFLFFFNIKQTWNYQDRLVCYAKLIETRDVVHSFHYIYYVRWSLPTAQRPMIPQSAYAFFTIKFNKNKPPVSSTLSALFPLMRVQWKWRILLSRHWWPLLCKT